MSEKGIDELIEYPFELVRQMSAEEFVRKILVEKLHTASVVVGPDYHFGYQRQGNPQLLKELGAQYGFEVQILEKEKDGDRDISSTYIRQMLADGNVEKAAKLLGYSYFVKGTVQHGRALGRTIGIPTINQLPSKAKLLPRFGVYATKTQIGNRRYCGISNVGVKPTVEGRFAGVETHLFSCTQDLYEQDAYVEFLHFLRPEQKFSDVEELKKQIQRDMEQAERLFGLRHSCEL